MCSIAERWFYVAYGRTLAGAGRGERDPLAPKDALGALVGLLRGAPVEGVLLPVPLEVLSAGLAAAAGAHSGDLVQSLAQC